MQYDLSKPLDKERFRTRTEALIHKGGVVELTERNYRSINQNSYLHLLIGVVAMETGNTLADTKEHYFKRAVNPALFCVAKVDRMGNKIESLRSSSALTQEEMSLAIDRFKAWAAENGIYLPSPGDEELLKDIAVELGRNKQYL